MPHTEGGSSSSNWGSKACYGEFEIVGATQGKPRLLGQGSFGKTFEATRTDSAAGGVITPRFALKVLNPAFLESESKRFQFIKEVNALTEFDHPNLIHYVRCGEEAGEVYYAMKLCRGGDLSRMVRKFGALPERVVAMIGLQIATGLHALHQRHRLVHRDIKPSNVMLVDELGEDLDPAHLPLRFEEDESLCRIVDFGLVDFTRNAQEGRADFVGTPMWASPEQICGQPVDGGTDIYSLGMTLWYLLQGKGPLLDEKGEEVRAKNKAMQLHTDKKEHTDALPRHLSEAFHSILARMVAKRPEERFGTARELQTALRQYLGSTAGDAPTRLAVTRLGDALETGFVFESKLGARMGCTTYLARRKDPATGEPVNPRVRLTVLDRIPPERLRERAAQLCDLAGLSQLPGLPSALLTVREVVEASDHVGFSEELAPGVSLADLLRVRAHARRLSFAEAIVIFDPIAEGLDFLLRNKRTALPIASDDIWLEGLTDPAETLQRPLNLWERLRPCLSMIYLPSEEEDHPTESSVHETISGSVQLSEADRHPVPGLARLIYRVLSGSEIATAAQFVPNAYVPTVALNAASNNLLRDIVSRPASWTTAGAVLDELCDNESVQRRPPKAAGAIAPSNRTGPTPPSRASGTAGPARGSTNTGGTRGTTGSRSTGGTTGTGSTGTGGSAELRGNEKTCEVVEPGLVRSPYDPERAEQRVAAEQWVAGGKVQCQVTNRFFRLPRRLPLLRAEVVSYGVIHSPYAAPGENQAVSAKEWIRGGEIVCDAIGKRLVLPDDLALPAGALSPLGAGFILSPYASDAPVAVRPELWKPGQEITCPVTDHPFVLPPDLPPFRAHVDPARPGLLGTPYAEEVAWTIPPAQWQPGGGVQCPASQQPLVLPPEVKDWPVEGVSPDPAARLIGNPCRPGQSVRVPYEAWQPGGQVTCPATGRTIVLPADLPPLVGTAIEGRGGLIVSPFSGEPVPVPRAAWVPGGRFLCPKTRREFLLPQVLPEWLSFGSITDLTEGRVRSPYDPSAVVSVPPEQWVPHEVMICPKTNRGFRLPENLPLLEGAVDDRYPGVVLSPFSGENQHVSIEDWRPGWTVRCEATGRPFLLPHNLREWPVSGTWVGGQPGRIRSPFPPHHEMTVPPAEAVPGEELTCPITQRRFRIPPLPSERGRPDPLEPPTEAAAAPATTPTPTPAPTIVPIYQRPAPLTPEDEPLTIVQSRRDLEAEQTLLEEALDARTLAEPLPPAPTAPVVPATPAAHEPFHPSYPGVKEATVSETEPGVAFSPYGQRPKIKVPPEKWLPGALLSCPETRQHCTLPAHLPLLRGTVVKDRPGYVLSPYATGGEVHVSRRKWHAGEEIVCTVSARPFVLPEALPEWPAPKPPWKLVGAIAGAIAIVAAGVLVGRWIRGNGSTGPATPPPRAGLALIEGGLQIGGWTAATAPDVRVFFNGQFCENVRLTSLGGEKGFRLEANLPPEAAGLRDCTIKLKLPGWEDRTATLAAEGGSYRTRQGPLLPRWKVPLPLSIPKEGTDYEMIGAEWLRALPGEPNASSPPSGLIELPINTPSDERLLPSGIYSLTLRGRDPDGPIKPYLWQREVALDGKTPSLNLPPSLAGERFGLLITDTIAGNFFLLKINRQPLSVELHEIELPKKTLFHATDAKPFIGAVSHVSAKDITLEKPTKLLFNCPIFMVDAKWTYDTEASPYPKLMVAPIIPGTEEELRRTREAMTERLRRDAAEIEREGDRTKYRDYDEFARAQFKVEKLHRYGFYLKSKEDYLKNINELKGMMQAFYQEWGTEGYVWFNAYLGTDTLAIQPTKNPAAWDVWPAPK
jgi:hypothetical protein